jgi:hypothetical protein
MKKMMKRKVKKNKNKKDKDDEEYDSDTDNQNDNEEEEAYTDYDENENDNNYDEDDEDDEEIVNSGRNYIRKETNGKRRKQGDYDITTKNGKQVKANNRRKEERMLCMLQWFNIIVDRERFLMYGDHYINMRKFLIEIPEGSNISRENMYIAYKKENGDQSPIPKEIIRKKGRKRIHFIVGNNNNNNLYIIDVDDLPPVVTNS